MATAEPRSRSRLRDLIRQSICLIAVIINGLGGFSALLMVIAGTLADTSPREALIAAVLGTGYGFTAVLNVILLIRYRPALNPTVVVVSTAFNCTVILCGISYWISAFGRYWRLLPPIESAILIGMGFSAILVLAPWTRKSNI